MSAQGRGADWWTHSGSSLRKLFKGVLHTVAPDDAVLPWAVETRRHSTTGEADTGNEGRVAVPQHPEQGVPEVRAGGPGVGASVPRCST